MVHSQIPLCMVHRLWHFNKYVKGRWYDFYDGLEVAQTPRSVLLHTPIDRINLHLRGGEILPIQEPSQTTMDSRTNGLGLIVSLDHDLSAAGQLYWDEGDSIDPIENGKYTLVNFEFGNLVLTSNVEVSEIINEYHKNEKKSFPLRFTHFEINGLRDDVNEGKLSSWN